MKKISLTKAGLHAWMVILMAVLGLLQHTPIEAQTLLSAQYKFTTCKGINVIVRESAAGVPVISYRKNGPNFVDEGAHFVYGDLYTNVAKEIYIKDTLDVQQNRVRYYIQDMRVVGEMCYFCGMREKTHREVDPETGLMIIDSVGILGRFRLDPSGFGPTVNFDLKHMYGTKILNRMATYVYGMDTVIAMTGIVDNPASQSCLSVARVTFLSSWKYNVLYTGINPREEFTDIAVNKNKIVIASYLRNSVGGNSFCLRKSKTVSIHMHDNYSEFNTLYQYTTNPYDECISFFRPDGAGVRLSAVSWLDEKVYSAFTCSVNVCDTVPYNTALCEINTDDMHLNTVQIVPSPDTLVDIKYLYKTAGDESSASVALLHQKDAHYNTVVEYPYALASSYPGLVPSVLVQKLKSGYMNSISAHNGNDVRFGGILTPALSDLTYLQELLPTISDESMCMTNGDAYINVVNKTIIPADSLQSLTDYFSGMISLEWAPKATTSTSAEAGQLCLYR